MAKRSDIDSVRLRFVLPNMVNIFSLFIAVIALSASPRAFAAEQPSDVPAWLKADVGEGEGQVAQVVLQRGARSTSKKCARARSEIRAILPWTLPAPTI